MTAAITTILAGTDGSPAAQAALRWAADLSAACGATVHVAYAWSPEQSELPPSLAEREKRRAEARLDGWCGPLREAGVPYKAVAVEGDPRSVLPEEAERLDADLVVIGRRDREGPLGGLGSVTHELVHGLHTPVAVVPAATSRFGTGPLVVGVDGSEANLVALLWAAGWATQLGRPLEAVHAVDGRMAQTFGREGWPRPDLDAVETELDPVQAEHGPIPLVVVPDLPVPALNQVAQRENAEAVVVGTHGRNSLHGLRLGRIPVELLHHSSGPVVVVPHLR